MRVRSQLSEMAAADGHHPAPDLSRVFWSLSPEQQCWFLPRLAKALRRCPVGNVIHADLILMFRDPNSPGRRDENGCDLLRAFFEAELVRCDRPAGPHVPHLRDGAASTRPVVTVTAHLLRANNKDRVEVLDAMLQALGPEVFAAVMLGDRAVGALKCSLEMSGWPRARTHARSCTQVGVLRAST